MRAKRRLPIREIVTVLLLASVWLVAVLSNDQEVRPSQADEPTTWPAPEATAPDGVVMNPHYRPPPDPPADRSKPASYELPSPPAEHVR